MKTHFFKRGIAGMLSLVMCLSAFIGLGTTTAFAAGEQAEVYLISFPRSGDANLDYSGTWGHSNLHYMNGWYSGESKYTTIRAMYSYDGNICYCIEPGVQQDTGDTYTSKDETFWDNLPSDINSTISPYDIKLFIGRIMQYGYTGPISTSWRSQNPADAAMLAEAMATQVLIWETVVGERDEDFDYVSPGSYDAVKGVISTAHPLYDMFCDYYDSIEASVQRHSAIPSFMSKNPNRAQSVELAWDGTNYTATLTDSNRVLSDYSFSANEDGISFSVSGNQLVITATDAPSDSVRITANKVGSTRRGIITWTDGTFNQGSGKQDVITYAQSVSDPVQAFLNLKVSYGSAKIVKTSEDGKVDNLNFTVTGNGINQTVKTNSKGEIQIDNLMPGVYTVTEMDYDKYEPQESRRVTVVSGQVSIYAPTLEKLREQEEQIIVDKHDGIRSDVKSITVNEMFNLWCQLKRGIKDSTFKNYIYMYELFVKPSFGKNRLVQVKKSDVRKFYNSLADGKVLKIATIDNVHNVLHQVFQVAVDDGMIRQNPTDNMLKELKLSHGFEREKKEALTVAQQKLFFDYMLSHPKDTHWYPVFYVMANTGMRVGEITGLRWSDIDLKKGIIRVNHTLVYYNHRDEKGCYFSINTPKTKAGEREIPMTEGVKQAFLMEREFQSQAEISSKSRVDGYDDFIFVNRYGDVQNQGNLNKALRRMMRDCNDEILEKYGADSDPVLLPQFSCHILRHTFATRLCESGANLKFIQSILGHADVSTTMNIYVDVTDALKKKEITAFDDYMTTKLET